MRINMPRGDLRPVRFQIYEDVKDVSVVDFTQIYMTCKKTNNDETPLFQKSLSAGSITKLGDGDYQFCIEPEDTNDLKYGEYSFDIEIINDEPRIKQTFTGTLNLTPETTWARNEVR